MIIGGSAVIHHWWLWQLQISSVDQAGPGSGQSCMPCSQEQGQGLDVLCKFVKNKQGSPSCLDSWWSYDYFWNKCFTMLDWKVKIWPKILNNEHFRGWEPFWIFTGIETRKTNFIVIPRLQPDQNQYFFAKLPISCITLFFINAPFQCMVFSNQSRFTNLMKEWC